jgi:uncharacterized protein YndB with AHSA1/START domain
MGVTIQVVRAFWHPAEAVFDAWLDPTIAGRFLFATPEGVMTKVEIDAKVGGKFNITERRGDQDAVHVGGYVEIDRPRRLKFRFGDSLAFDATYLTVEIVATAAGSELTLTHEGVGAEWEAQTRTGWTVILEGLAGVLTP